MSSVSTSDGKEASHRYRSLSLRQIRLEGLVPLLSLAFVSFRDGLHWAVSFSVLIRIETSLLSGFSPFDHQVFRLRAACLGALKLWRQCLEESLIGASVYRR